MTSREVQWLDQRYRREFKKLTRSVEKLTAQAKAKPKDKLLALRRDFMLRQWEHMREEWNCLTRRNADGYLKALGDD
jgi:hypothetical protein